VLLDIVHAAELVLEFKGGMHKTTFLSDAKTQSAILHQLMVMGEAVKNGFLESFVLVILKYRGL